MAETMKDVVKKNLRPGYLVMPYSTHSSAGGYAILQPDGSLVKDGGRVIQFLDQPYPSNHFKNNLLAQLRRLGAIKPKTRDTTRTQPKPAVRVAYKAPKNAVIIAEETLRDVNASPRERALARNYLELFNNNKTLKSLAQRLGQRLKEIEKLVD